MYTFLNSSWSVMLREWITSPLAIVVMSCFVGYLAFTAGRRDYPTYDDEDYEREGHILLSAPLQNLRLTKKTLKDYNSENPKCRYLVALQGTIYDVSSAPDDFGPKGAYAELSGTDILGYIEKAALLDARDTDTFVNEWKTMMEDHFYEAGVLVSEITEANESTEQTAKELQVEKQDVTKEGANKEELKPDIETFEDAETIDSTLMWNDIDETIVSSSC